MEKKISFTEWFRNYTPPELIYYASYDPDTGQVVGIYPGHSAADIPHKILIDNDIAESIITGATKMFNCVVDRSAGALDITETKNLVRIDDVLHRITDTRYTTVENPDVLLTYNKINHTVIFELSEMLSGTMKVKTDVPVKARTIHWSGDTEMQFLFTHYNDPNAPFDYISFTVSELQTGPLVKENFLPPEKFSIYTRRLFKKYAFEEKCEQ